ncbi:MAG: hypothetical protein ACI9AT_002043 [Ulvibacter sp.]|jgi:hypothetical protein
MNSFKDFDIKPETNSFVGDKISLKRIFNSEIKVIDYKIQDSIKKESSKYLTIQVEFNNEKRVIFTGSSVLMQQIEKVPKEGFPFTTKISNNNEYFEFT